MKDCYLHYEKDCYNFVGRIVTGMDFATPKFEASPVYWIMGSDEEKDMVYEVVEICL